MNEQGLFIEPTLLLRENFIPPRLRHRLLLLRGV